jgi:hypothetical protein
MRGVFKHPALAIVGLLFAATACGSSGSDDGEADDQAETTEVAPVVTRPRPTAPTGTAAPAATTTDLLNLIPKAGDIGPLQLGIPAVAAIRSMAAEVSTDPTGPCGAAVAAPTLEGAAGRTYDTVKGRIVAIVVPRGPDIDSYVEANRADLTEGCASHTTTAANGSEQTLSGPTSVDVSATAPDGIAWVSTIEQPGPGSKTTLLLPNDELTVMVTMSSPEPIDPAFVQLLAEVYTSKLAAA